MAIHEDLTGEAAIHPFAYRQGTDPGAVGAYKGWVDTSSGPPYQLKIRNAANTAWEVIGATYSAASETTAGIAEIATQDETDDGSDDLRFITPEKLANWPGSEAIAPPDAAEDTKGIAELATQEEVNAGEDEERIVTPFTLAARTASLTRAGLIELATQEETDEGSDAERAVTPATLAGYVGSSGGSGESAYAQIPLYRSGVLAVGNSPGQPVAEPFVIRDIEATLEVAGTGSSSVIHIWKNGANVQTITFPTSSTSQSLSDLNISFARGDDLALRINSADSGDDASGLSVTLGVTFGTEPAEVSAYGQIPFYRSGVLAVGNGPGQPVAQAFTLVDVEASLEVGGTGSSSVLHIRKNGTNIQSITFPIASVVQSISDLDIDFARGDELDLRINSADTDEEASGVAVTLGVLYDLDEVGGTSDGTFVAPVAVSTSGTVAAGTHTELANASSGVITRTLPTAVGRAGKTYVIKKVDTSVNVVAVATTSSQTIDGAASPWNIRFYNESLEFRSDGANWHIHAESIDLPLDDIRNVAAPSPSTGDLLGFDGTNWVPVDPGSVGGGSGHRSLVELGVDRSTTSTSYSDVTGMSIPVVAGVITRFQGYAWFDSAATTTGSKFALNGPAFTRLAYVIRYTGGTTMHEQTLGTYDFTTNTITSYLTGNLCIVEGIILPSSSGTLVLRFATEVGGSAITVKSGSTFESW